MRWYLILCAALAAGQAVADVEVWEYDTTTGQRVKVSEGVGQEGTTDGTLTVWAEKRNAADGFDVFASDSGGPAFLIAGGPGDQENPDVSGGVVVWDDNSAGGHNVWMLDTAGGSPVMLAPGFRPRISGDIVAYGATRAGQVDVYAYDLAGGGEWAVTNDADYQVWPDVGGDYILWTGGVAPYPAAENDVYGYQISTGQQFLVSDAVGFQFDVSTDGGLARLPHAGEREGPVGVRLGEPH